MKEYIERAAILENLGYEENRQGDVLPGSTFDIILKEPAADVAPVRHGSWVFDHMTGERAYYANCSECGNRKHFVNQEAAQKEKYCSLCGARMEKEDNYDKHTSDE